MLGVENNKNTASNGLNLIRSFPGRQVLLPLQGRFLLQKLHCDKVKLETVEMAVHHIDSIAIYTIDKNELLNWT